MKNDHHIQDIAKVGYFIVRNGFSQKDILEMRTRLEDIVRGKFAKVGRRFQADTESGRYEDVQKSEMGYRGPDVAYRKIADLEYDDVFLEKLQSQWIKDICAMFLGDVSSVMRVTMMDKPAMGGTPLPWHSDVSLDWPTIVQPELGLWFSVDEATEASGSMQVIPGSHRHGMIGRGHLLAMELEAQYAPSNKVVTVEMKPGDCLFFHASLLHRSGVNTSNTPRRAVNAILMPGHVMHTARQRPYPVLHGEGQLSPVDVAAMTKVPY